MTISRYNDTVTHLKQFVNLKGEYTMSRVKEIAYSGRNHGSFEQEWLSHKKASEWWYATGFVKDEAGNEYSYQYTVIKASIPMMTPWISHVAITDFNNKKHYFTKKTEINDKNVVVDENTVKYGEMISLTKNENGMHLIANGDGFSYDVYLDYGKGAFWHCDNGYLLMGSDSFTDKDSTIYYSYPSMPTKGTMTLGDKTFSITGTAWFDKQGGIYNLVNAERHWEWFSLRFFDDEQIMLFSFPQHDYVDGTYIMKNTAQRMNNYTIKSHKYIEVDGLKFTSGWDVSMPGIKEETYTITPIIEGQMHNMYFEELCNLTNSAGEIVGKAFVELLPGVWNKKFANKLMD